MRGAIHPSLYQINTRVWLGRAATLDDLPDAELDRIAAMGFEWVWFLSVWSTGAAGQRASRVNPEWRHEFERTLPDLTEEDIAGSGFAITGYQVHPSLGGPAALARLRERLRLRGLRLMLDFVPNHTALDHPWSSAHPDSYVQGSEADLQQAPANYVRIGSDRGGLILAHGRDPYFPGWPDTLQLDYSNPSLQEAMIRELVTIAGQCDGVRCDMAMLVLPDVFERTWGRAAPSFWPAAIGRVREHAPGFVFLAEVYWDLEWTILQQGFDYAYDKRLYDRLRDGHAGPVRDHLRAGLDYQTKLARFMENHDEPRAAAAFRPGVHEASAVITYLTPGLRFFHQGQLEGRRTRISPHLVRAPDEPVDETLAAFYQRLLSAAARPEAQGGQWRLFDCAPAWDGNWSNDCMLAWGWDAGAGHRMLVTVNFSDHQSQCYVTIPACGLAGHTVRLRDLLGPARYDRDGHELESQGLYLDLAPWGHHAFEVATVEDDRAEPTGGEPTRPK